MPWLHIFYLFRLCVYCTIMHDCFTTCILNNSAIHTYIATYYNAADSVLFMLFTLRFHWNSCTFTTHTESRTWCGCEFHAPLLIVTMKIIAFIYLALSLQHIYTLHRESMFFIMSSWISRTLTFPVYTYFHYCNIKIIKLSCIYILSLHHCDCCDNFWIQFIMHWSLIADTCVS